MAWAVGVRSVLHHQHRHTATTPRIPGWSPPASRTSCGARSRHLQLPAGEHEHALALRMFAGRPARHRASARTRPGGRFTTKTGDPQSCSRRARPPLSATPGVVQARRARGSGARAAQAGSSARAARHLLAPLRFNGRVRLSRAVRLRQMRVAVERTLFEHGRREELARSRSGRRLRPFALRHVRGGRFTSHRRGGPRVRLQIRRLDARGGARLDLRLTRVRTRDIRALCTVLPAGVSPAGRPLELETRLRLRDRGVTGRVTMRQRWRCVRDRKGEFTGIRPIKPTAAGGASRPRRAPRGAARVGVRAPRDGAGDGGQPASATVRPCGLLAVGSADHRRRRQPAAHHPL